MIYILTGAIRTGKTTALLDWIKNRNDVDGLICPDGNDRKRYFFKVKSQEEFELEVDSKNNIESHKIIEIGPFQFLKSAFEKANEFLIELCTKKINKYIIIDELGKLELRYKGLHDSAITLINSYQSNINCHLILVVRESLLTNVIKHYCISEYSVLNKEDLKNLL